MNERVQISPTRCVDLSAIASIERVGESVSVLWVGNVGSKELFQGDPAKYLWQAYQASSAPLIGFAVPQW